MVVELPLDEAGNKIVRIGHSPDPDDAFMFHAMTTGAVSVKGSGPRKWSIRIKAKIDTGAKRCSIDEGLAEALGLERVGSVNVRNAMGQQERILCLRLLSGISFPCMYACHAVCLRTCTHTSAGSPDARTCSAACAWIQSPL